MTENVTAAPAAPAPAVPKRFGGKGLNIAIGVAAVVTVIGIALWVFQLTSAW